MNRCSVPKYGKKMTNADSISAGAVYSRDRFRNTFRKEFREAVRLGLKVRFVDIN